MKSKLFRSRKRRATCLPKIYDNLTRANEIESQDGEYISYSSSTASTV